MNEHAEYYSARLPEPTTLLGLTLRPFSLGHLLLLNRISSYFVGADEKLTHEDLALSVLICSLPYAQAVAAINDPDLQRFMAKWAARLTGRGVLTALGWRKLRVIPLHASAAVFAAYLSSGTRKIDFTNKGDGKPLPLPLVQLVRVTLLQAFGGLTDEALLDRPWGLCMEDYLTVHAIKSNIELNDLDALGEAKNAAKEAFEKLVAQGRIPHPNGAN